MYQRRGKDLEERNASLTRLQIRDIPCTMDCGGKRQPTGVAHAINPLNFVGHQIRRRFSRLYHDTDVSLWFGVPECPTTDSH
jgi:hypothetical protein